MAAIVQGLANARVVPGPRVARTSRYPQHQFFLKTQPWSIQPFLLAPVLPGETLKRLMLQSRVVSDPIKNPLIGWWCEYYFFYVKHRDLDDREALTAMMLDPNYNAAALQSHPNNASYYNGAASIAWARLCLKRVVEEYFRDSGEAWDVATINGLPAATTGVSDSWLDSLTLDSNFTTPDLNVDLNADTVIKASEVESALRQWEFLRYSNMTTLSYEDFLRTYGVHLPAEETHKPELIRYVREWTYPVNTIDPTNGTPRSALSWKISESADKDRFFKEPGFIFGVTVARPKVYRQTQTGALVGYMDDAYCWLPATLAADPQYSWRKFAAGTGPIGGASAAYWVDMRDLFLYGDQFLNVPLTDADKNIVTVPTNALTNKKYAAAADVSELFVTATTAEFLKQDGVVSIQVLGRQRDSSPRMTS